MTSMVMAEAVLERLGYLLAQINPENERIAKVNRDLLPLLAELKKNIKDAAANHNIADEAKSFGREVTRLSYEFEDLNESYLLEVTSRRKGGFLNKIFERSSQQIKDIEKLGKQLGGMKIQASKASDTSPKHHAPQIIQSGSAGLADDTELTARTDDARQKLVSSLISGSPHLRLVWICGPGGIGKTTLAQKLFNDKNIKNCFEVHAWVCVSQNYKTKSILQEILPLISERWVNRKDAMDMPEDELAKLIYKSLKGRRYLIVLEDVWSVDAWISLRMVFPDDNKGSRILITSRNQDVAKKVGGLYIHDMVPLREEATWSLLRQKLGLKDKEINPEIERIGKRIAQRCQGLPLAVVAIADVLSEKPIHEWELVLKQLGDTSLGGSLRGILNLSYENLPLHLRLCLLYLANFPEDAYVELDTLCQLWIAEGLIPIKNERGKTMMDVAESYLEELDRRSFVQISEEVSGQKRFKSYKIHDLIHDFCQMKGKEEEFFEVIDLGDEKGAAADKNQTMSSAIRRAIYLDKYECRSPRLYGNADYLRSLLFFGSSHSGIGIIRPRELPNLDSFVRLRVLYLYGVDFKDGKFPKGVEKLIYLRYLSFRECYLVELSSSVGNMFYLQTLDLRVRNECEMTIPDVLNSLENLRYLYLPLAYQILEHKKLSLGSLKELEIIDNFDTSLCNAEDLGNQKNLKELTVTANGDVSEIERILNILSSSHLRCLSLNIRDFDCSSEKKFLVMKRVFSSAALHTLEVEGYLGKSLPELDKISCKLTKLVLNGSKLQEDPMQVLQKISGLRYFVLEIEAYVGKRMKCDSSSFQNLRYLKLSKLYNLEKWEINSKAMPELRTLVIKNCKKLQMLPDGLQFICELRILEIASMTDEFLSRIQKSDGTAGEDFKKLGHKVKVKVDGQHLILKEQHAGPREDPQSSSML